MLSIEEIKAREQAATQVRNEAKAPAPVSVLLEWLVKDGYGHEWAELAAHSITDIPALIAEVERLTDDVIPEIKDAAMYWKKDSYAKDQQIVTLKKALELAKSNMAYIATTRDICKVCRYGCKESRVHCAKFEWNGIHQMQKQGDNPQ
jgi:hypothetical protein